MNLPGRALADEESLHSKARILSFDFKKIELMRVVAGRAPEVHVGKVVSNAVQFHAFHEEEVFPQGAAILAGSGYHWAEVTDDRVPDAIVAEVDFFALLEFVA